MADLYRFGIACIASLVLLASAGCDESDYRPTAVGEEGVVTVIMDSTHWQGPVGDALRSTIGQYISTLPQPERAFNLRIRELDSRSAFDRIKKQKNIVFVAPLSDSTTVANFLRDRLDEDVLETVQNGNGLFAQKPNLWRRQQMVIYLTGPNPSVLAQKIESVGPQLRSAFNEITRQRMTEDMFDKGRQHNLEDTLMAHHGFAVNVQHDYQIVIDTTTAHGGFIYMRRVLPETWRNLMIYYTTEADPSALSPEWIKTTRDSLTKRYVQGSIPGYFMKIDQRDITQRQRLRSRQIDFLGRYAYEVRGIWHLVKKAEGGEFQQWGMAGPFVSYGFYDRSSGRMYLIDGAVYAPKYDKREFLRQMEVIAHTFRTKQETRDKQTAAR